ncbi:MAG: DNA mismatch repair protein MutH [Methanobrevibacter sp.]|uniref:Sau3AI family type II restriction endonuclease n=1 Tax=Methanobrevibacter sp. TaxID=66852 RepID=UPI0025EE31F6|nr:Sau3AI family type II restriction endonuclease [Methanobrevibacter sp.]MBE6509483.1 DNA mismatch repair protein MutH [Methanobrevibacter sp.]
MKFKTEKELLEYTSNIKGKTFKEIDTKHLLDSVSLTRAKGLLGHVVESGFYDYPINSDSRADFEELDIELKVTGYVKNKNGSLRAKERLVLSKINFNEIVNETFESSHVLGKCRKMLIIWYEYDSSKDAKDFMITDYQLYDMSNDLEIFSNDFEIIKGKVLEGKAHELSEGDTSYLGACTKARTSADRTTQPYSDILPKPRAYSLKNAYMTGILRELAEKPTILEINSKQEFKTVIEYVNDKLKSYFGKTQVEILEEITGRKYEEKIPKNISKMISDELIGKDEDLSKIDGLFTKTSFIIKNLPIQEDGKPRERMSFKTISLSDFETDWEDSYWKNYFEETTLITICYQEKNRSRNGFRVLKDVKQITFDENDLDEFEKTYNQIKIAIEKKDVNLLPTSSNGFKNQLLEIAPKSVKGANAYANFFKNDKTKVSFMISKKLLNKKLVS